MKRALMPQKPGINRKESHQPCSDNPNNIAPRKEKKTGNKACFQGKCKGRRKSPKTKLVSVKDRTPVCDFTIYTS